MGAALYPAQRPPSPLAAPIPCVPSETPSWKGAQSGHSLLTNTLDLQTLSSGVARWHSGGEGRGWETIGRRPTSPLPTARAAAAPLSLSLDRSGGVWRRNMTCPKRLSEIGENGSTAGGWGGGW